MYVRVFVCVDEYADKDIYIYNWILTGLKRKPTKKRTWEEIL